MHNQTRLMWSSIGTSYEMYYEGKSKLGSHNTSYCLIEVATDAGSIV